MAFLPLATKCMSAERYTFDTNILFYALDPDAAEKHRVARHLIGSANTARTVLLLQTLGELCNSVRKKRPNHLDQAHRWVQHSTILFDIVSAQPADLLEAIAAQQQHNIAFWDALLWATARRAGCTLILTEDLQDGRILGGVTVRNPFLLSETEFNTLLA